MDSIKKKERGISGCELVLRSFFIAVYLAAQGRVLNMRDSWRVGVSKTDRTELVTSGIYQISRNPAFLGFDLLYIGILLKAFIFRKV